ncbi:DUF3892 domain-containing protein [Gluconobacter cerinus]|uniref:DUF3892 domain-containing protein n=1 Tax=Gluconobacter cerinus TaxID=38307 RepID=UPI001B8BB7FC|nr:DUF3892 domain-containing protein [Gluconobacter cerinus]MBS1067165.1 DUF3892 domain-containing protein [Gluconobacter cerinus]
MAKNSAQIMCINKRQHHNPHERIINVGGISNGERWKITEQQAIHLIETGEWDFFCSVNGRSVAVVVAIHAGRKYLKTTADSYAPNNLLSLPECPPG